MSPGPSVERRIVSILFADLVGFTALSEALDAEDVAAVQERYFGQVRETIGRHGGRLEKFIGDAAMAVFGLPRTRDDDAERAVRAALALAHSIEALSSELGLPEGELRLRVGVNSGEVAYSTADGEEWRVSGDAVNVAARLQAAAAPGSVLVGEATALSVAESIALDPPVELELKGKSEPVRAWSAVSVLPHRSRERALGTLHAPLIGREPEMAALEGALERARDGATETHLVVAPPGVGKSRLIDEFVRRATAGGQAGLVTRSARLRPETIAPSSLASQLLAGAGDEREVGERLVESGMAPVHAADLAHEVAGLLGGSDGEARTAVALAAEDRTAQFHRWIEALDGLAGEATTLWLIEDLHWAGGDVLAFVEQATLSAAPGGRLVVATARDALLESVGGQGRAQRAPMAIVDLRPLPGADATNLIRALVADALPARLEQALVERSDGNALFIEELLRSWVSLGTLRLDPAGRWQMTASPDDISLPHTVHAIYAGQLDDLPQGARLLARRAAVAGRHVPRDSLESLELGEVEESLSTVRRRALLADGAQDPLTGAELRYRHALLRDAGYASLSRAERARFHARLARWYQDVAGPRAGEVAEQVAGHYAAALENSSRLAGSIDAGLDAASARRLAIEWYERAADQALSGAAHETVRFNLRRAIDMLAEDEELLLRGRLLLRLGEATAYTADMDEGAQLMEEARATLADAYARTHDPVERREARAAYAAAAAAIGRVWVQQIRFDDAIRLADETLAAIGGPEDAGVARLLGLRAWVRAAMLDAVREVPTDLQRGLEIARASGDRQLELDILHWRAMARGELGLAEEDDWDAVKALAVELGDWSLAVKAMRSRASWLVDDDAAQVWALADEAEAVCRRRGLDEDLAWIDYLRSEVGFVSGDWSTALDAGRRAIELGERNAYHRAVVRTWHVLLPIAEARDEREIIEHAFRWFEARRDSLPDSAYARVMYWVFEARFIRAGLRPPAVPDVVRLLPSFEAEPGGPSWVSAIEDVVETWLAAGMLTAVADALERTDRAISEEPGTSSLGRGVALHLRARLNAVEAPGSPEASHLARAALDHFRRSRAPWWMHKSLSVLSAAGEAGAEENAELRSIGESLGLRQPPAG